jgi:hypothetical protein
MLDHTNEQKEIDIGSILTKVKGLRITNLRS